MEDFSTSLFDEYSLANGSMNDGNQYPFNVSACPEKAILMHIESEERVQQHLSAAQHDAVIILFVYPVIILFGLLANFTFLLTIYRVREMRTVTNFYLANLAVSDIMFISSTAVSYFYLILVTGGASPRTKIGCILLLNVR